MMQLTLTGEVLKQAGLDRVERRSSAFVAAMRTIAKGISLLRGHVSCDELREAADKAGLRPCHPNAWGSVFRGPGWVVVGHKESAWPSTHQREIKVWKWEGNES